RIQRIVLGQLLDASVLRRIQNNALKTADEQPLQMGEVFRTLTEGIWNEYPVKGPMDPKRVHASVIRRNLQRQHVKDLTNLVLGERERGGFFIFFGGGGGKPPPDARSLARLHLREIQRRIAAALNEKNGPLDDTTLAHLEECRERIGRVLNA